MAESGFISMANLKFEGGGSKSESLKYLVLVAQVTGEATGDQQLLQIAQSLPQLGAQ